MYGGNELKMSYTSAYAFHKLSLNWIKASIADLLATAAAELNMFMYGLFWLQEILRELKRITKG